MKFLLALVIATPLWSHTPHVRGRARELTSAVVDPGEQPPDTLLAAFYPGDGNTEACTCDAPAIHSGQAFTFARGSAATCSKKGHASTGIANGDLVSCASGEPRIEPNDDDDLGLRLDGTATNQLVRSMEMDQWSTFSSGIDAPTVTANAGTAPDGTSTADRLQVPACPADTNRSIIYRETVLGAAERVQSIYVKSYPGAGAQSLSLCLYVSSPSECVEMNAVEATWTRYDVVMTGANPSPSIGCIYNTSLFNGSGNTGAADVLLWGGQLEDGDTPTAFIPTTNATVTRADEGAYITLADNIPTTGSAAITFQPPNAAPVGPTMWVSSGPRVIYTNTTVRSFDGTNEVAVTAGFTASTPKQYTVSWGEAGYILRNETDDVEDTDAWDDASWTNTQVNLTDVAGVYVTGIVTRVCIDDTRTGCVP